MSRRARILSLLVCLGVLFGLTTGVASAQTHLKVVATGLDNPRHLEIGRFGTIYVAEAGRGGSGPCLPNPEGEGQVCAGPSGALTAIFHGHQRRILTGLSSISDPTGGGALGPADISLRRFGGAYLVVGLGGNPADRAKLGSVGQGFGKLYKISLFGRLREFADVAGYEATADPDKNEPGSEGIDTDPYAVQATRRGALVADAGGNDLLRVHRHGDISTVAVFPFRNVMAPPGIPDVPPEVPMQPVPTDVVRGPDGAYYVSELTGFPFPTGAARVYRVVPGEAPEVYASGFTNISSIAFGRDGSLYVLEIAKNGLLSMDETGALIRVRPDGSRSEIASEGLVAPTGLAISRRGKIYVSNHGDTAGNGEVLRLDRGR
jgi:hypothetical protein